MSVLDDVLRETRTGATPDAVARRLGLDLGLVEAALDRWEERAVVVRGVPRQRTTSGPSGSSGCGTCRPVSRLACAGCPFATL